VSKAKLNEWYRDLWRKFREAKSDNERRTIRRQAWQIHEAIAAPARVRSTRVRQ
jgi:hypothetical protein